MNAPYNIMSVTGYFTYIALLLASLSVISGHRFVKPHLPGSSSPGLRSYSPAGNCEIWGCPANYVCQRPRVVRLGRYPICSKASFLLHPSKPGDVEVKISFTYSDDVRAEIDARLIEWNTAWNARDFQALENFYTTDSLFLPPGAPIRRGNAGFAEFISGLITANNWGTAEWTVDEISYESGDLVTSVDTFRINSAGDGPVTLGKSVSLWKRVNGVYLLQYEAINFDG